MDGDIAGGNIETQLKKVCAAEIKKKKLQIFKLPSNKSIEDILRDLAILQNAVNNVFTNLTTEGSRTAVANFNIDTAISSIAAELQTKLWAKLSMKRPRAGLTPRKNFRSFPSRSNTKI